MGMYLRGLVLAKVNFQACARRVEGRPGSLFSGSFVVLAGTQIDICSGPPNPGAHSWGLSVWLVVARVDPGPRRCPV